MSNEKHISEFIEEILTTICNDYCKFPDEFVMENDNELMQLMEKHCDNCPLNLLRY